MQAKENNETLPDGYLGKNGNLTNNPNQTKQL